MRGIIDLAGDAHCAPNSALKRGLLPTPLPSRSETSESAVGAP
jgi:hypothetical protein